MLLQSVAHEQQLGDRDFVTLRHGALLQTAGGQDLNMPPLLPVKDELLN